MDQNFELTSYFLIWITSVLYSIYSFTRQSQNYFKNYDDQYSDFAPGWAFIGRKKDVADYEWQTVTCLIKQAYLWAFLTVFVAETLRKFRQIEVLKYWQILISAIFVWTHQGLFSLALILAQPSIHLLILNTSKFKIWSCSLLTLLVISALKCLSAREEVLILFKLTERQVYIVILALFWTNLRCVSFCLDSLNHKNPKTADFFSYCLYLPTLFCGPFIPFQDFKSCQTHHQNAFKRFVQLVCDCLRFLFWMTFTEFCLHFIYVNATGFHPEWVQAMDSWSLYGYGYTMGQFFHIKYVVIYGFATSLAKFDNIKVPMLPVCIGRIHLYSDMWKYFDVGLYNFLLKYIYLPTLHKGLLHNKILSSLLCFTFVYTWHGTDDYVMIWTILNFIGVVIENAAQYVYKNFIGASMTFLGPHRLRRFSALLASPLLAMSAISNFYFFARSDIGHIFLARFLNDKSWTNYVLISILYCCCQISTELRTIKKQKQK